MKQVHGWWFPDHETHIWRIMELSNVVMNDRLSYQGMKQQKLLELCEKRRTMLDIGAHVGLWSYNMALEFDKVHAFEPMEEHRECFRKNVTGVELHECALGESNKTVGMKTTAGNSGDTFVFLDGNTPMRRLDEFNFDAVDAIKMDCQGYEPYIIDGMSDTIIRNHPVIVVEEKAGTTCIDKLAKFGYVRNTVIHGDHFMTWKAR
jgi:FkbM family methyltransferase